jgi:sarcosine oxidase delta subunit
MIQVKSQAKGTAAPALDVTNDENFEGTPSKRQSSLLSLLNRSLVFDNKDAVVTTYDNNNEVQDEMLSHNDKTTSRNITNEVVFSHDLGHIPKSGTSFAFGAIAELVWGMDEYQQLAETKLFRPCNEGAKRVKEWKSFLYQHNGRRCNMWMTEPGWYNADAEHSYVIIREPVSHTLSMYFHCKESKEHENKAHLMPTLDDWIRAWHDAQTNTTTLRDTNNFHCYNPTNFQSRAIAFNSELGKEDIRKKWDIIGDHAQMEKTICLIVIKYTGWIPKPCDCTNILELQNHRQLYEVTYDKDRHAHGVTHHGSTFSITQEQRQRIQQFRNIDMKLYDLVVSEIFEEQVQEVEHMYNIQLCNKLQVELV